MSYSAVQDKIDRIGFGRFHVISILICGTLFIFQGASRNLFLSSTAISSRSIFLCILNTSFFLGAGLSTLLSTFGRRPSIVLSLVLVGLCGYAASMSPTEWGMRLQLSLSFFGLGLGIPPAVCLVVESAPSRMKALSVACLVAFSVMGEFTAANLVNRKIPESIGFLSAPVILSAFFAVIGFIPESPAMLLEDCFTLNATLRLMARRSTHSTFVPSPSPSSLAAPRVCKVASIIALAGVISGVELFHVSSSSLSKSIMASYGLSICLLIFSAGLVSANLLTSRSLLMIALLLGSVIACSGIASPSEWKSDLVFAAIKAVAVSVHFFAIEFACKPHNPDDRLVFLALMLGCGQLVSFVIPLPVSTVGEETAFAVLFGSLAVVVLAFVEQPFGQRQLDPSSSLYDRGTFGKIPIVSNPSSYGSI